MNVPKFMLLLFFPLLVTQQASAQLEKANWLVEGSIGNISSTKETYETIAATSTGKQENKSLRIGLTPLFGYFITDKLVGGINAGFNYFTYHGKEYAATGKLYVKSDNTSIDLALVPFVRYYFAGNEQLRFYAQAKAGTDFSLTDKQETIVYNTSGVAQTRQFKNPDSKLKSTVYEGLLGANYFLGTTTALNCFIGYGYNKVTIKQSYTSVNLVTNATTVGAETNLAANSGAIVWGLGFTIILPNNKK